MCEILQKTEQHNGETGFLGKTMEMHFFSEKERKWLCGHSKI